MEDKCCVCGNTSVQKCIPKYNTVVMGVDFGLIISYRCDKHKITDESLKVPHCCTAKIEEYGKE